MRSGRRSARHAGRRAGTCRSRRGPRGATKARSRATPARARTRARTPTGRARPRHSASSGGVSGGRGQAGARRGDREGEAPLLTRQCAALLCSLSNYSTAGGLLKLPPRDVSTGGARVANHASLWHVRSCSRLVAHCRSRYVTSSPCPCHTHVKSRGGERQRMTALVRESNVYLSWL